jgi:predicted restriction endonuclease
VSNGIALCKTHHWALDRGVITIKPKTLEVVVSSKFIAQENNSISALEQLNGTFISGIREIPPNDNFLEWHNENVYVR